jgi:DNA-directed RNA polymerase specialized sigma24 family protein
MMTDLFNYPNRPGYKRDGTSKAAAQAVKDKAPTIRDQVLSLLKRQDCTPDEAAAILGLSILTVRPRFSELSRMHRIIKTGSKRRNDSGMNADVYTAI